MTPPSRDFRLTYRAPSFVVVLSRLGPADQSAPCKQVSAEAAPAGRARALSPDRRTPTAPGAVGGMKGRMKPRRDQRWPCFSRISLRSASRSLSLELAVAVRVVLLQHLRATRLALGLHGLALVGVELAVVVRVELLQHAAVAGAPRPCPRRPLKLLAAPRPSPRDRGRRSCWRRSARASCLALLAVGLPFGLGRLLLLGIEHAVLVGVVLLEQLRRSAPRRPWRPPDPLSSPWSARATANPAAAVDGHEGCDRLLH